MGAAENHRFRCDTGEISAPEGEEPRRRALKLESLIRQVAKANQAPVVHTRKEVFSARIRPPGSARCRHRPGVTREPDAREAQPRHTPTMDKHTIKRDGHPPIVFRGELIAEANNRVGNDGNRANRWTEVAIYKTKGGNYVARVSRFTCWQGETDHHTATAEETPAALVTWLMKDDGTLGSVSQEAVEKAAKADPGFAAAWVEEVE